MREHVFAPQTLFIQRKRIHSLIFFSKHDERKDLKTFCAQLDLFNHKSIKTR